ncbi:hypothetical protein SSTU70S_05713 [Stutzerimonas stutzeri]
MKGHGKFRAVQFNNHFGLKDQAVINEAEALFTTLAAVQGVPAGDYGTDHLKAIHKHMLGDIYPWAGEFRSAKLMVGDEYATSTAPPALVELEVDRALKALQAERPSELTAIEFADRMAMHYTKLYGISPFPDGNARATRFLLEKFADDHGMQIKWQAVPGDAFNVAVSQALNRKREPLKAIFRHIVDHQDLYALYSVDAVQQKVMAIATAAGLDEHLIPSQRITDSADLRQFARHAKLELAKDLENYQGGNGATRRDWDRTSIQHEINNSTRATSGVRMLHETLHRISDRPPSSKGPSI